ncbi:MAG: hypothetical protein HKL99_10755 [Burkholderiales bacterium]|nr:hypothetical protein [Burkholderiales bacterium]
MRGRDLYPAQWAAAFAFLAARESWVIAPASESEIEGYMRLVNDVHDWAVSCIKSGVAIDLTPEQAQTWKMLAYVHIDLFVLIATIALSDEALTTLCRPRQSDELRLTASGEARRWAGIAADRLAVLDIFASAAAVFSPENLTRLRTIVVP